MKILSETEELEQGLKELCFFILNLNLVLYYVKIFILLVVQMDTKYLEVLSYKTTSISII